MGAWRLTGCTITGGTLLSTGGTLVASNATNVFDGVTLNADLDIAQTNAAQVTIKNVVTLATGRTISIGAAGGATYGYLYFTPGAGNVATLATSGTASVVLGASVNNLIRDAAANTTMTIGAGITVSGGTGGIYSYQAGSTLTIAGTVDATTAGQTITVGNNADLTTIAAGGIVRASGGILTLTGTWTNSGTIAVSAGTVNLSGTFGYTSVQNARWNRSGGTVNLVGTLTIGGGNTLTHTTAMGVWRLAGCLISGGTLTSTGGTLVGTNTTSVIDGVILDANVDLTTANAAQVTIKNVVTLATGRTISIGAAGGATYGYLYFTPGAGNVATLTTSGTASVVLGASVNNLIRDAAANTTMTIGAGITVSGGAGGIYTYQSGSTLAIAGTIDAASAATTVTVGNNANLTTITGTLKASTGILTLAGTWTNSGTIITQTGTINLGGAFGYTSVVGARWNRSVTDTVNLTGVLTIGAGNTLTLDALTGSWQVLSGTVKNGTLIDTGSRLVFTASAGAVDGVTIPLGTVIDLGISNGASVYLNNSVTINGTIKVGRTNGATYGRIYWNSATAAWGGSGNIVFGASTSNAWTAQSGAGALTIGSGLLIHGSNAIISATVSGSSLVNNGTISTDVAGGAFPFTLTSFTNNGTLIVGKNTIQNWSCSKNFTQSSSGMLELDIGGGSAGQADRLAFSSGASAVVLGGTLRLISSSGFVPTPATSVDLITIATGSVTGSFATVQGAYSVSYAATKVTAVGQSGLTAPVVTLATSASNPTTVSPIPVTATFTSAVTGFTAASLVVTNASVSGFSGSGTTYAFNLIPLSSQGTVSVSVPAGAASDAQFLTNPASNLTQRLYNGVDPTIAVISPAIGTDLGGTTVTITGTGYLAGSTSVMFGGASASVGTVTATTITCIAPAGAAGTTVDLQVAVAGRSVTAVAAYTYSALALPAISALNPASGLMAGGTAVTITGVNLNGTTAITFAGVAATSVNVVNSTTVICVTPAYTGPNPLAVDVQITTGIGNTTSTGAFYYGNSPTVVVGASGSATGSSPITFTIIFSASVNGLTTSGLVVTNGTLGTLSGSGTTYSIPVTPLSDGAVTVGVSLNAATDTNGLSNLASNVANVVYDTTPPTVAITPISGTFSSSPITFLLTFSEPIVDFSVADLALGNGVADSVNIIDSSHYTVPITPSAPGAVSVTLSATTVTDAVGNANAASATATVTYTANPTVVVTTAGSSTNVSPISFTLTFSAPVTGLGAGGLTVTNGTIGTITGSGTTYSVPVTPTADGSVSLQVQANAATDTNDLGNVVSNLASVSYDGTAPTVVISPSSGTTSTSPIIFSLDFSEAVSGLASGDLAIGNGTAGAITAIDALRYTVPVTPLAAGAVTVALTAVAVSDVAGNANALSASASIVFLTGKPTVLVTSATATNVVPIVFTLTFSAPVTGLSPAGLTVTNGTSGSPTGSGTSYSLTVTPTTEGAVTVLVNADAAFDGASQGNLASNLASAVYDITAPTVVISPTGSTTTASPIPFSLSFSEAVTGLDVSGLTVGNGVIGTITGSGASYTVPVTPSAGGAVSVSLNANAVTDAAGNTNAASTQAVITYTSIITFVPLADAVGIIGSPIAIPLVANSTALLATVSISTGTDLVPLGLTLATTNNGRALLSGTVPVGLTVGTYPLTFSAADGISTATSGFSLTVVAASVTTLSAPTLPLTDDTGPARFVALGLATPEGIQSVMSALVGKDRFQARAFAFDNGVQSFVELPSQPIGGLTAYSGMYLVSRLPLTIDLSGSPVPMPAVLVLKPGWSFLGVPPIHDGVGIQTTHLWDHFQLQTSDGTPVANPIDLIGTPGGALTTTEPYWWNGSGYTQVTTLSTGTGYFFKNNGSQPLRLVRTANQIASVGALLGKTRPSIGAVHLRAVSDRGMPPPPPGFSGASANNNNDSSGSRCGAGSGVGVLGIFLLALYRLRLRRRITNW